jgi:hypothetical protein
MSTRLKKIDDGHYLVPDSDLEVVLEGHFWAIYRGNDRLRDLPWFEDYGTARRVALHLRDAGREGRTDG